LSMLREFVQFWSTSNRFLLFFSMLREFVQFWSTRFLLVLSMHRSSCNSRVQAWIPTVSEHSQKIPEDVEHVQILVC
jgi:hypothetical protein